MDIGGFLTAEQTPQTDLVLRHTDGKLCHMGDSGFGTLHNSQSASCPYGSVGRGALAGHQGTHYPETASSNVGPRSSSRDSISPSTYPHQGSRKPSISSPGYRGLIIRPRLFSRCVSTHYNRSLNSQCPKVTPSKRPIRWRYRPNNAQIPCGSGALLDHSEYPPPCENPEH